MDSVRSAYLVSFGPFQLNLKAGELSHNGDKTRLQEQPFQILKLLLEGNGEVVTREEIRRGLWPNDTMVEFDHSINAAVKKLRIALGDSAEKPRYVETVARRGYRLMVPVQWMEHSASVSVRLSAASPPGAPRQPDPESLDGKVPRRISRRTWIATLSAAVVLVGLASRPLLFRPAPAFSERDTIAIAEFTNATGERLFDPSLKQALAIELGQSPFLNIFPEDSLRETLRYMGRSPEGPLTPATVREVCERRGIKAMLTGSISRLGSDYVIGLEARDCLTGSVLAQQQVEAQGKEQVLRGLGKAASRLRVQLGESLSSLSKFDSPIEQATTPSLEALQAFSLAEQQRARGAEYEALPFLKRAIELDPNFAMAAGLLGTMYDHLGDGRSVDFLKKAYDLRDRVSEREKLYISAHYYEGVIHDLEKQNQVYELWKRMYPRDPIPYINLGANYAAIGKYEDAAGNAREAVRLAPDNIFPYATLAHVYLGLNRTQEARELCEQAIAKKLNGRGMQWLMYNIAFVQTDTAAMERQLEWAKSNGEEPGVLFFRALAAAYRGKMQESRQLLDQSIKLQRMGPAKESPEPRLSSILIHQAVLEAEAGYIRRARAHVGQLNGAIPPADQSAAGVAFALAGDSARAQAVIGGLVSRFPHDTYLNNVLAPSVRAVIAIHRGDPRAAIDLLWSALPYELGSNLPSELGTDVGVLPTYLRAQAYLQMRAGKQAAVEFQKIIGHRGVAPLSALHVLAVPGLARAFALEGETSKALAAYEDFFALWKDADADIPILLQAKAEYARLRLPAAGNARRRPAA